MGDCPGAGSADGGNGGDLVISCCPAAGVRPAAGGAAAIRHVIIVMLENRSYDQVVGSPAAPYETGLARECGSATEAFGATHGSAANYLAVSAGQYPSSSIRGCDYYACASNETIYASSLAVPG